MIDRALSMDRNLSTLSYFLETLPVSLFCTRSLAWVFCQLPSALRARLSERNPSKWAAIQNRPSEPPATPRALAVNGTNFGCSRSHLPLSHQNRVSIYCSIADFRSNSPLLHWRGPISNFSAPILIWRIGTRYYQVGSAESVTLLRPTTFAEILEQVSDRPPART